MNFRNIKISPKRMAVTFAVFAIFVFPIVVFATANVSNVIGPNWDDANQEWVLTGHVDSYTGGATTICLRTHDTTAPFTLLNIYPCSQSNSDFTCSIPGSDVANRSDTGWNLQANDQPNCTGTFTAVFPDTRGTLGTTGPNAITLQSINATATASANWLVAALLAGFATLVGVYVLRKRNL